MILYIKRAVEDILKNRFLNVITIVTISLSIFTVSAFLLFFNNTNEIINSWKSGMRIMAYLKPDIDASMRPEIERKLLGIYGVKTAKFISKDRALLQLKENMPRQLSLFDNLKENPLPDAFEILVLPSYSAYEKIDGLSNNIESLPSVDEVEYGQQWFGRFSYIFNLFRLAGYAVGGFFFVAAVFIVANTIRLVFYSRRTEIEIMRLVGATDSFIKVPFYFEGIIQGTLGGMIGLAVLFIIFTLISSSINAGLSSIFFSIRFLSFKMIYTTLFCSMFIGWLGSYISIKQFFKM